MRFGILAMGLTSILFVGYGIMLNGQQKARGKKITEEEIKVAINNRSDVDECQNLDQIQIDHLEYHDFIGDGQEEAVVVASTCMTGTAGPDIHTVYKRDANGRVVELPFRNGGGDPSFKGSVRQLPIFGNALWNRA